LTSSGKAYLAPIYDMASKEIVAWDISQHPDLAQQQRLLAMLERRVAQGSQSDPALGHGLAIPASLVAATAQGTRHPASP
jgi:hypothetical protein